MKKIVKYLLVLSFICILSACGSSKPKGVIVNLWNPFSGPDGEVFNKMVKDFNIKHKDKITIKAQTIPNDGNAYYDKIKTTMSKKSSLPDMAVMHIDQMPSYAKNNVLKEFSESSFSEAKIDVEDYYSNVWEASSYEGKQYSIPFDIHPMVLWINNDLISEKDIPKTYEQLKTISKSYNKDNKFAFGMPNNPFVINRVLYGAMLQNNALITNEDGSKALYNSNEGIKALKQISTFAQDKSLNPPVGDDVVNLFKSGEVAMTIEGIWMKNGFKEADLNVSAIPMSTLFADTPASWASAHTFVQFDNNQEKSKEILEVIKYFNENTVEWLDTGKLPVTKSTLESSTFKNMDIEYNLAQNMNDFAFFPNVVTSEALWLPVERYATEAYLGNISVEQALKDAEKEGNAKAHEVLK